VGDDRLVRENLRRWAEELVDLTKRNRLLYFRHTQSSSLEFAQGATEVLPRLERTGWSFHLPDPPPDDSEQTFTPSRPVAGQLVVDMSPPRYGPKIDRGLKNLATRSQSEFLDTGLWVLYLGLGRLKWVDTDGKAAASPLLLVPVRLENQGSGRWQLTLSEDGEAAINPALAVKLERDHGITLPTIDELDEPDAESTIAAVRASVSGEDWTVEDTAVLTTFTFQKEVIYRDLRANEDEIVEHEMVRLLAEGPSSDLALALDFEPDDDSVLDERHPPEDLACVRDADATQRKCLIAARAGQSFVMDGPPGTGKSQTITNVIAQLLADGKTVLFVSEKAAALEVVQNRLAELSLDPFVLPLHSHNATRKAIAQELGRALSQRPAATPRFDATSSAALRKDRERLSAYATAINQVRLPLERSLHDAIGQLSKLDRFPGFPVPANDTTKLTPGDLVEVRGIADQLGRAWGPVERGDEFVWRHLRPSDSDASREGDLRRKVDRCISFLAAVRSQADPATEELRLPTLIGSNQISELVELIDLVERRHAVGAPWLTTTELSQVDDHMTALAGALRLEQALRDDLDSQTAPGGTTSSWVNLPVDHDVTLQRVEASLAALSPSVQVSDGWTRTGTLALGTALTGLSSQLDELAAPVGQLAATFGFPGDPTLQDARRLADLGKLVGAADPPEATWLAPSTKTAVVEARRVLAELLTSYRERRAALHTVFGEEVLQLDLTGLNVRFTEVHTGISKLGGKYRADKKTLAAVSVTGKASKDVIAKLDEALEWQRLSQELAQAEKRYAPQLGDRYYGQRDDVDLDEVERAIQVADRALALAAGEIDQDHLAAQLALGATPDPTVPLNADRVLALLERIETTTTALSAITTLDGISDLSMPALRSWIDGAHSALTTIAESIGLADDVRGTQVDLESARALLARRSQHHVCATQLAELLEEHSDELGPLATELTADRLEAAQAWVREIHEHFDGAAIKPRTATVLLVTELTAAPLRDAQQNFDKAIADLLGEFHEPYRTELERDLTASFDAAEELLDHLGSTVADASEWTAHIEARTTLSELGWEPVIEEAVERKLPAVDVGDAVERAVLFRWTEQLIASDGRLNPMRAVERDTLHEEFRRLDAALVRDAAAKVINACSERRPKSLVGQAGIIQQQAQLKRRHKPVRKLLAEAGDAAQRLKPCFMMSPLSVSQFLPPGLRFDVVIFDEASQVREADAICCVYRGDQLIVAGDPKQLPPTAFFQKMADNDDDDIDDELLDFESILDRCKAQGFRALPLNWHYRSRHESLITFSNYSFYEGRLHTFPGAVFESPDLGVGLFKVDGEYRRGATRDNPIEAETVVDRIVYHRRHHPEATIGVVALSVAQQTCIEAAIERRSETETELRDLVTDSRLDGFFVKNLENVQGDERDIIVISIGYGPDEVGKLLMNFGPMSRPGGERRLNVAVTRAKRRVDVVSSVSAGQIKSDNPTTRHLARYLDYAERGTEALALDVSESMGDADSPFEEEVIRSIITMGYEPVPQVGVAGYRVDIGIRHPTLPGSFLLGVECDGATYHSSKVARDRDRLRQEVLEGLGWTIHRIWSTAWFVDRQTEEQRLQRSIEAALRGPVRADPQPQPAAEIDVVIEEHDFDAYPDWAWAYEQPSIARAPWNQDFIEPISRPTIARQINEIVTTAGPIHEDDVLAVLRDAWLLGRAGTRIREAFRQAVAYLAGRDQVEVDGHFLSVPGQEIFVRVPEDEYAIARKVTSIAPAELQLAIVKLLGDAGAADQDGLRTAWARLFGWRRVGSDIEIAFEDALEALVLSGAVLGPDPYRLAVS
jgi:very-short-patch-repair endonuclease